MGHSDLSLGGKKSSFSNVFIFVCLFVCLQGLQWLTQKCRFGPWILESAPWICQPWMSTHTPLTSNPSPPWTSPAFPPPTMRIFPLPELSSQAWIINMISNSRTAKVSFAFAELFPSCPHFLHPLEHVLATNLGLEFMDLEFRSPVSAGQREEKEGVPRADLHPARAAAGV